VHPGAWFSPGFRHAEPELDAFKAGHTVLKRRDCVDRA